MLNSQSSVSKLNRVCRPGCIDADSRRPHSPNDRRSERDHPRLFRPPWPGRNAPHIASGQAGSLLQRAARTDCPRFQTGVAAFEARLAGLRQLHFGPITAFLMSPTITAIAPVTPPPAAWPRAAAISKPPALTVAVAPVNTGIKACRRWPPIPPPRAPVIELPIGPRFMFLTRPPAALPPSAPATAWTIRLVIIDISAFPQGQVRIHSGSFFARDSNAPRLLTSDSLASSVRSSWNTQSLARINVIRILQERFVGFEDFLVFAALAVSVLCFRDLPKRVARLHDVEFRFRCSLCRDDVVFDLRHSLGVSNRENDFIGFGRRWSRSAERHLAAVNFDIDLGRVETVLGDLFLQFFGGCGRSVGGACRGGRGFALASQKVQ